ncbi:MAG TPA: hypothetical protein VF462_10890, partial [Micromonosporaceae bacterium]
MPAPPPDPTHPAPDWSAGAVTRLGSPPPPSAGSAGSAASAASAGTTGSTHAPARLLPGTDRRRLWWFAGVAGTLLTAG